MFVNLQTDLPAWILSHDADVVFADRADLGRPHHTLPSHDFFAAHREATAAELHEFRPSPKARATAHKRKPAALRKNAGPKKAAAPKPTAPRRPSQAGQGGRKAAPPAAKPADADKPPPATRAGGGEPHGE